MNNPPLNVNSNPLAPEWMIPSWGQAYQEQSFRYAKTFTVPAGEYLTDQVLHISQQAPFTLREIAFFQVTTGADNQNLQVRMRDGEGRELNEHYAHWLDIAGPLAPAMLIPAGSDWGLDFRNLDLVNDITVQVVLKGSKRGARRSLPPQFSNWDIPYVPLWQRYSEPDPGWRDHDYHMYFEFDVSANQPRLTVPLPFDDDDPTIIQGLLGEPGDGQVSLAFSDPKGNRLSNELVLQEQLFSSDLAMPIYPEIWVEPGSTLTLDYEEVSGNATTLKFAFACTKRVPER